jgi:hypothetical protein
LTHLTLHLLPHDSGHASSSHSPHFDHPHPMVTRATGMGVAMASMPYCCRRWSQ